METNGLADPCQLVQMFWLDDYLMSKVQLHSCVCLVDCHNFMRQLNSVSQVTDQPFPENELLLRQMVYADKILLNKTDLSDDVESILACITHVNTSAKIIKTKFSQISIEALLEISESK